jgi:hypothetical protein
MGISAPLGANWVKLGAIGYFAEREDALLELEANQRPKWHPYDREQTFRRRNGRVGRSHRPAARPAPKQDVSYEAKKLGVEAPQTSGPAPCTPVPSPDLTAVETILQRKCHLCFLDARCSALLSQGLRNACFGQRRQDAVASRVRMQPVFRQFFLEEARVIDGCAEVVEIDEPIGL